MKKEKSVLISGYYGAYNVGDDLLLQTIIEKLQSFNKNISISVITKSKNNLSPDIAAKVNCIEIPKPHPVKFLRILVTILREIKLFKAHDIYLYGGGTRLFETANRSYQSLFIKFVVLKSNKLFFKRKVIHLGVGIGDVFSKKGKWLLKQILLLSDLFLFRDKNSFDKAFAILGKNDKIFLGSDLLFLNGNKYQRKGDHTTADGNLKIGLSLFQYYGNISGDAEKEEVFKADVLKLIDFLLNRFSNAEIYLFSFQKNFGSRDEDFNNELYANFQVKNITHVKYSLNTDKIIKQLSLMDLCIGMRYHFCLVSLFFNIKTIGINYQPKIKNEFEELGLDKFCVEVDNLEKIPGLIPEINYSDTYDKKFSEAFHIIENRKALLNSQIDTLLKKYL